MHSDLKIDIVNSTIKQLSVSNKKYIFYLNNCNNVIINGNKSILIGQKPTEVTQQAGISIENGCKNIIIQGLTLSSFGGDGLILGGTENNISNNLSIKNCVITNNLRNGISLVGGLDSVYIENCDINRSSGANPQAGIDIETWKNTLFNNNIFIYKNKFSENVSGGLKIFENSNNIFVENNIFGTDNELYLNLNLSYKNIPENAPNNINIKRNIFENSLIYGENQLGVINIEGNEINSNGEYSIALNFFDNISNVYQSPKNIEKNILNKQIHVDGSYNLSIHNNAYKNVTGKILYTSRAKYIKFYENDIVGYNIGAEITSESKSSIISSYSDEDVEIYNNNVIKTQDTVNVNNFVYADVGSREVLVHDNNLNDTDFSLALYGGSWVSQEGIAFRNRDDRYLNMPMREFPVASSKYSGVILNKLDSGINNSYICVYDTATSSWNWKKIIY